MATNKELTIQRDERIKRVEEKIDELLLKIDNLLKNIQIAKGVKKK